VALQPPQRSTLLTKYALGMNQLVLAVGLSVRSLVARASMVRVKSRALTSTALPPQRQAQTSAHQQVLVVLVDVALLVTECATHTRAFSFAQTVATCLGTSVLLAALTLLLHLRQLQTAFDLLER
jgi:IS4 transposase